MACPLCLGISSCWGGGNRQCAKRDPRPSHIAGILDSYGGVRVVVTYHNHFQHHIGINEYLCIVHGKTVHEPIAWGDHPYVIALGERAVARWVEKNAMTNDPDKQEAIRAYRSRQTWQAQRSLDISKIVFV